jgi:hypothetical protein
MKYSNSEEFRQALEQKLKKQAELSGRTQDYVKLREQLAIERFLARMDPEIAIVKGGAAAMFTLTNTPHTSDVDLIIVSRLGLIQSSLKSERKSWLNSYKTNLSQKPNVISFDSN